MKKLGYVEPSDYFPKDIRKKNKLGEYADKPKRNNNNTKTNTKSKTTKK